MAQRAEENRPLLGRDDYDREGGCSKYLPEYITRRSHLREFISFMLGVCLVAACVVTATLTKHADQVGGHDGDSPLTAKRNLVFMVSDGMGPASVTLARNYRKHVDNLPIDDVLVLDRHFWGTSRTRSSSALVTDSAAGATAFSCARKSYNGAISVTPDERPCGSVLEAAKRAGYHTGLVATTYVTDATPACFASHVLHRDYMSAIAMQEIGENVLGRSVDLILGGGRCYFLPNSTHAASCREDATDVARLAQDKHGWSYSDSRQAFDALARGENIALPHLGLYADHDIPYEIDRRLQNATYPSLSEMAATALRALERATEHSDRGFFIMIEGSRIDHAGHHNDPAAQVHEVLEYDRTFQVVLDFIARSKTQTVLVSTSDHETGGLATAITEPGHSPVYDWYPQILARANASCELLAGRLQAEIARRAGPSGDLSALSLSPSARGSLKAWIDENLVKAGLGIPDARDDELDALVDNPKASLPLLAGMISLRAHLGWSTAGHTAVDVNIYTSGGPGTDKIRGNVENTDVGGFLSSWLDVDVDAITNELIEKGQSTGRV